MCTLGASLGGLIFQSFSGLRVTRVCFFSYKESSNELPIMDLEQLSTLYLSSFHFFPSYIFFFLMYFKANPRHQVTSFKTSLVFISAAAAAKSLQSCPTLCDPIDGSPSGSPVPGILQARTLEWVAIFISS